tara:strand:- start:598 stop:732 length:135 start_codon:yes stop_codon:yes gene_type:complete
MHALDLCGIVTSLWLIAQSENLTKSCRKWKKKRLLEIGVCNELS